jgi:hypothetical protein
MSIRHLSQLFFTAGLASVWVMLPPASADPNFTSFDWLIAANNGDLLPGTEKTFNSYNPPSINGEGLVVFRARSRGPQPMSGIYVRDMSARKSDIARIADRDTEVPAPNNLAAAFNEFPSIPRIGIASSIVATRGNSSPVWSYQTDEGETRAGTTGVYLGLNAKKAPESLITAASLLGAIEGFEHFAVPLDNDGGAAPTKFDVFPGAPSPTDEGIVAFKGNYTTVVDGTEVGQTGVFYREMRKTRSVEPVRLIANTSTTIPNLPKGVADIPFGSTAPPSAANGYVVFVGYDDEQAPNYGGIYLAPLSPAPTLKTLVSLGAEVPGEAGQRFNRFGEGLSFDGRFVAFWGAWGDETKTLRLHCPTEGNQDRRDYCNNVDPNTNQGDSDERWQEKQVPVNQGIFVHDTRNGKTRLIARTGPDFDDFLYWNYSGAPPGGDHGDGDAEPPRWRSSAFVSVSRGPGAAFWTVFQARNGDIDPNTGTYVNPIDGIYLSRQPDQKGPVALVDTTMSGAVLDPEAVGLTISSVALEREGLRRGWLAITASMADDEDEEDSWAGIYVTEVRGKLPNSAP